VDGNASSPDNAAFEDAGSSERMAVWPCHVRTERPGQRSL